MNQIDRLERDLTAWFDDSAVPRTPDYADDILRQTARMRQRPRWTFPERWLPAKVIALGRGTLTPIPWRTIGLLAVLALLIIAALAAFVGSQRRLPAPFGPAANGLVAYSNGGDILTVDPDTGERRAIVTGPEADHDPRFSLDGTRLVFLRATGGGDVPIIADADGSDQVVAKTDPLVDVDAESVAWSPDGRSVAFMALTPKALHIIDTIHGEVSVLDIDYDSGDLFWRPPDGRQLLFLGGPPNDLRLILISVADASVLELPVSGDRENLRPAGWTPDGQSVAFHTGDEPAIRTHVVDLATEEESVIELAFGQLSNDGNRIVGINGDGSRTWLCVASSDGGPCVRISEVYLGEWGTYYRWSPNDEWIITTRSDGTAFLLDPDGVRQPRASWAADGAESWQRKAP